MKDGGEGKITYHGESKRCVLIRKGMGVEELRGLVQETVEDGVVVEMLRYSLKYDRNMIMAVDGDTDMRMMFT